MRLASILGRAIVLVAVPGLLLVSLLVAYTLVERRQAHALRLSMHSKEVLEHAQQLHTHLSEAQAGIRGFLISRQAVFLTSYHRARAELPGTLHRLEVLTDGYPEQRARVRVLQARTAEVLAHYDATLARAGRGGLPVAAERDVITNGRHLMDGIREEVGALRRAESRLDASRLALVERTNRRVFAIVAGGTGAALLAVVVLGAWFHRTLSRRVSRLTGTARLLAEGHGAPPPDENHDELEDVDKALREMAGALASRQRAAVGALADAVSLFNAANTRRAVLDVAAERAIALTGAGVAVCTLAGDGEAPQQVVAAAAGPDHPAAVPSPGAAFSWAGADEVLRTGRLLRQSVEERQSVAVPAHVERVLAGGDWIGVPLSDDQRATIGVLQVAALPGRAFRPDEGDVVGTLAQAASVALALERSRQKLEALNADLALTNRENELFIYSVSHDLRSPLVNLEGFSRELTTATAELRSLASRPDVPEDVRAQAGILIEQDVAESVRFIRTAVGRIASIIDGLLRLSRAGRVEYRTQRLSLDSVLQRIVDAMQATIASAGAEVRISPLPEVAGDALAIEQLFANLLGNALAYARAGVPARIEVTADDDLARSPRFTVVRVRDNGLGIPEAQLDKVFQPLQRLHPGVGRGEGMGLAIVRRIVERHDGRVWVQSEVGAGTTFYVELPRPMQGESADAA